MDGESMIMLCSMKNGGNGHKKHHNGGAGHSDHAGSGRHAGRSSGQHRST